MSDLFKLKFRNNALGIELLKDLQKKDFGPVSEKLQSIRFILDDDWEYKIKKINGKPHYVGILKLRLKEAPELVEEIRGKVQGIQAPFLSELLGVHKVQESHPIDYKGCKTEEEKKERERETKKKLEKMIEEGNKEKKSYQQAIEKVKSCITQINKAFKLMGGML